MSTEPQCPHCGAPQSKWVGHEVRGVYDGVLFWVCDACERAWSRNWEGFGRRAEIAASMVEAHNAGVWS